MRMGSSPLATLLLAALSLAPHQRAAAEANDPCYIVEENGGVTLSNLPRSPMPRNAVVFSGPGKGTRAPDDAPREAPEASRIPELELCMEDGRTIPCDLR